MHIEEGKLYQYVEKGGLYQYNPVKRSILFVCFEQKLFDKKNLISISKNGYYAEVKGSLQDYLHMVHPRNKSYFLSLDGKPIKIKFSLPWKSTNVHTVLFYKFLYDEKIYYITKTMINYYFRT